MTPTNQQPLVSVVIPAYNSAAFIGRAVGSALAQTWRPIEIIVVDDGSSDNTCDVVDAMRGPIRCIRAPHGGAAAARNRGIEESRGEFVAFLDSDDEWLPERLARGIEPMLKNPGIGLAYCRSRWAWPTGPGGVVHEESVPRRIPFGIYPPPYICTPATVIRRECFARCGLFDPEFTQCEDMDLFTRIAEQFPIAQIEEPLVLVHSRAGSLSKQPAPGQAAAMYFRYVNRALERAPDRYDARGARAVAHLNAGIHFFDAGQNSRARAEFFKSLKLRATGRAFLLIARTLIPGFLNRRAAKWRRARRGLE